MPAEVANVLFMLFKFLIRFNFILISFLLSHCGSTVLRRRQPGRASRTSPMALKRLCMSYVMHEEINGINVHVFTHTNTHANICVYKRDCLPEHA